MKVIILILILFCVNTNAQGQTYIKTIKNNFLNLDSTLYVDNVLKEIEQDILSQDFYELANKSNKSAFDYEYLDILRNRKKQIITDVRRSKILFSLDFNIDTSGIQANNFLLITPTPFKFHLYCFDKKVYPTRYILFYNGKLDSYSGYPTFSKEYLKQAQKAYKVVLRKKPQFLLFSWNLPNTVVYVLNDKIYVCRVIQRKIYELDEYVRLFKHTIQKGY